MPQISLTGTFRTSPDQLARIAALLADHIRLTRVEPGCLSFQVTPSATDPCTFHVAERFTDCAAFQAHQDRVAISAWGLAPPGWRGPTPSAKSRNNSVSPTTYTAQDCITERMESL